MKMRALLQVLALGAVAACGSKESGAPAGVPGGGVSGGVAGQAGGAAGTGVPVGGSGAGAPVTGGTPAPAGAGGDSMMMPPPMGMPVDNPVAGLAIAPECQGIDFNDILYSPGGSNLPDICQPFHPTLNNPYAVRCVDAWPWFETKFPGDEFCILPPPLDQGVQFGMHPQGNADVWFEQVSKGDMSGYDSAGGQWVMTPGAEAELNYQGSAKNPTEQNFYRNYVRMRAGSHHMINAAGLNDQAEGTWGPGSAAGLSAGTGLPGAQRPDENTPKSLDKPAEDAGLYGVFPANPSITYNVHHFNSTSETTLKESWVNLWWEADATIRVQSIRGLSLLQAVTLSIAPNTTQDLHYAFNIAEPIRILTLFGHRHAWTSNFSAWVERPGGEQEIVYQSFDWFDQPTYRYDSATTNPEPAPDMRADGGHTGVLTVVPGERLHFNCHITFTDARAAAEGAPSPNTIGTIGFANEAFTGEMCILFGSSAGTSLGAPAGDPGPLPSFATVD